MREGSDSCGEIASAQLEALARQQHLLAHRLNSMLPQGRKLNTRYMSQQLRMCCQALPMAIV